MSKINQTNGATEREISGAEAASKIISVTLLCTIMTQMATSIYIKGLSDELIAQLVVWAACVFLLLSLWPLANQLKAARAEAAAARAEIAELERRLARLESAKK